MESLPQLSMTTGTASETPAPITRLTRSQTQSLLALDPTVKGLALSVIADTAKPEETSKTNLKDQMEHSSVPIASAQATRTSAEPVLVKKEETGGLGGAKTAEPAPSSQQAELTVLQQQLQRRSASKFKPLSKMPKQLNAIQPNERESALKEAIKSASESVGKEIIIAKKELNKELGELKASLNDLKKERAKLNVEQEKLMALKKVKTPKKTIYAQEKIVRDQVDVVHNQFKVVEMNKRGVKRKGQDIDELISKKKTIENTAFVQDWLVQAKEAQVEHERALQKIDEQEKTSHYSPNPTDNHTQADEARKLANNSLQTKMNALEKGLGDPSGWRYRTAQQQLESDALQIREGNLKAGSLQMYLTLGKLAKNPATNQQKSIELVKNQLIEERDYEHRKAKNEVVIRDILTEAGHGKDISKMIKDAPTDVQLRDVGAGQLKHVFKLIENYPGLILGREIPEKPTPEELSDIRHQAAEMLIKDLPLSSEAITEIGKKFLMPKKT